MDELDIIIKQFNIKKSGEIGATLTSDFIKNSDITPQQKYAVFIDLCEHWGVSPEEAYDNFRYYLWGNTLRNELKPFILGGDSDV